jgi:hypothetical protein
MSWRRKVSIGQDEGGAAYIEFLIAFMPIFIAFVGLWELGEYWMTSLVVEHAAFAGARAGAVYIPLPGADGVASNKITDDSRSIVTEAVLLAAAPAVARGWLADVPAVFFPRSLRGDDSEATGYNPDSSDMVHVQVVAPFRCHFPPFDYIFCRSSGGQWAAPILAHGSFPYAGARYKYAPQ